MVVINSSSSNNNVNSTNEDGRTKMVYSPPASPAAAAVAATTSSSMVVASPSTSAGSATPTTPSSTTLSTPAKQIIMLRTIREKVRSPHGGGHLELQSSPRIIDGSATAVSTAWNLHGICPNGNGGSAHGYVQSMNVIKDRYLVSTLSSASSTTTTTSSQINSPPAMGGPAVARTTASYRHLIDQSCTNLRCTDVFTEEQFLCKIINEPLHRVQRAYFQLSKEEDACRSRLYGHQLIRGVHDIVPLSKTRTYAIIAAPPPPPPAPTQSTTYMDMDYTDSSAECEQEAIYEDLHTYIRNKRRLCEAEARALFHQICQTVQVCHRNGIILRDLKLKRFYFIDAARTKLQYESLEGSMILDDPADDTLSDKIGCPLYTAPELLCPRPTYRGKPADMWSLGVILYTMLVGQYPFYEKANCNLITVIRHCHVQIPSALSKSVRMLLLSLLRKNHEDRLPTEYIFHSPWLREQKPYYMYIPADICISDDDDNDDDNDEDDNIENVEMTNTCNNSNNKNNDDGSNHCGLNLDANTRVSGDNSENIPNGDSGMDHDHGSTDSTNSGPLDYSCRTLRMDCDVDDDDQNAGDDDDAKDDDGNGSGNGDNNVQETAG